MASSSAVFSETWVKFCNEFGGAPLLHGSLEDIFQSYDRTLTKIDNQYELPKPDTTVNVREVKVNDQIPCRIYTPSTATGKDSLGVYFHGGGWAMGNLDSEDDHCRLISKQCNMVIVSADYRLAPKHKFPKGLDDCANATRWALENRESLGANDHGITILGASAGANLALCAALKLVDAGLAHQIVGVVAIVPVTIHPDAVPTSLKQMYTSYDVHAEHTSNTKDSMMTFFDAYGAAPDDQYLSCLLHPGLRHLRRVYMTEMGADTLRDDARLMKMKLESLDVEVRYDDYPGYPHFSWRYPSKLLTEHREEFYANLVKGINWVVAST